MSAKVGGSSSGLGSSSALVKPSRAAASDTFSDTFSDASFANMLDNLSISDSDDEFAIDYKAPSAPEPRGKSTQHDKKPSPQTTDLDPAPQTRSYTASVPKPSASTTVPAPSTPLVQQVEGATVPSITRTVTDEAVPQPVHSTPPKTGSSSANVSTPPKSVPAQVVPTNSRESGLVTSNQPDSKLAAEPSPTGRIASDPRPHVAASHPSEPVNIVTSEPVKTISKPDATMDSKQAGRVGSSKGALDTQSSRAHIFAIHDEAVAAKTSPPPPAPLAAPVAAPVPTAESSSEYEYEYEEESDNDVKPKSPPSPVLSPEKIPQPVRASVVNGDDGKRQDDSSLHRISLGKSVPSSPSSSSHTGEMNASPRRNRALFASDSSSDSDKPELVRPASPKATESPTLRRVGHNVPEVQVQLTDGLVTFSPPKSKTSNAVEASNGPSRESTSSTPANAILMTEDDHTPPLPPAVITPPRVRIQFSGGNRPATAGSPLRNGSRPPRNSGTPKSGSPAGFGSSQPRSSPMGARPVSAPVKRQVSFSTPAPVQPSGRPATRSSMRAGPSPKTSTAAASHVYTQDPAGSPKRKVKKRSMLRESEYITSLELALDSRDKEIAAARALVKERRTEQAKREVRLKSRTTDIQSTLSSRRNELKFLREKLASDIASLNKEMMENHRLRALIGAARDGKRTAHLDRARNRFLTPGEGKKAASSKAQTREEKELRKQAELALLEAKVHKVSKLESLLKHLSHVKDKKSVHKHGQNHEAREELKLLPFQLKDLKARIDQTDIQLRVTCRILGLDKPPEIDEALLRKYDGRFPEFAMDTVDKASDTQRQSPNQRGKTGKAKQATAAPRKLARLRSSPTKTGKSSSPAAEPKAQKTSASPLPGIPSPRKQAVNEERPGVSINNYRSGGDDSPAHDAPQAFIHSTQLAPNQPASPVVQAPSLDLFEAAGGPRCVPAPAMEPTKPTDPKASVWANGQVEKGSLDPALAMKPWDTAPSLEEHATRRRGEEAIPEAIPEAIANEIPTEHPTLSEQSITGTDVEAPYHVTISQQRQPGAHPAQVPSPAPFAVEPETKAPSGSSTFSTPFGARKSRKKFS